MLILSIVVAVSIPAGHAFNNVHTLFTNATTVGACGTLCKGLSTTSGTASTSTVETIAIGSSPTRDSNATSAVTGTWSTGTSFALAALSTNTPADTIIVMVAASGTVTQNQPSAAGITFDAAPRLTSTPASCTVTGSEWIGHTTGTLSSVIITINLSGTPSGAAGEAVAFAGSEDPTGTFSPFDQASSSPTQAPRCTGGGTTTPTATSATTLNADDTIVALFFDQNSDIETAGTGFNLDLVSAGACCSIAVMHQSVSVTGATACSFGTKTSRWLVFCDALQSAVKYFKVEPETSASLAGTPSTAANGFSGTGWVFDTAGIQNGLNDIQSGTWQIDLTGAVLSTAGTPVAHYFVTAWKCPTDSCSTATFLWSKWDTMTNVASSTTATLRTYTSASQPSFASWSGNFLAFEVWAVLQYSGSTTSTTLTETTVSTAMDFITPGWDYARSLGGTLTLVGSEAKGLAKSLAGSLGVSSSFAGHTSRFRSLTGSLTLAGSETKGLAKSLSGSVSVHASQVKGLAKSLTGSLTLALSLVKKSSLIRTLAASITFVMGNMVANVDSGKLICNSSPRSCSASLTSTLTMTSGLVEHTSRLRSLSGSLSIVVSETKGLARLLTGSLGLSSNLVEHTSWFRAFSGSLTLVGSEIKGLIKNLSGSLGLASSLVKHVSLSRSFAGSLSLAGSEIKGLTKNLSGSLGLASGLVEHVSLSRSLSGSLSLAGSEVKGLAKGLTGSLSLVLNLGEHTSLSKSLASSLGLAGSEVKGLAKGLTGSIGTSSSFAVHFSLFRTLTGTLSLTGAQAKGFEKALTGSLGLSSSTAEKFSFLKSISSSISIAGSETKGLAESLTGYLSI